MEWGYKYSMNTKSHNAAVTSKARENLKKLTTGQLLDAWKITETRKIDSHMATVRGWLMDEMEARHPAAFAAWMESESSDGPEVFLAGL